MVLWRICSKIKPCRFS